MTKTFHTQKKKEKPETEKVKRVYLKKWGFIDGTNEYIEVEEEDEVRKRKGKQEKVLEAPVEAETYEVFEEGTRSQEQSEKKISKQLLTLDEEILELEKQRERTLERRRQLAEVRANLQIAEEKQKKREEEAAGKPYVDKKSKILDIKGQLDVIESDLSSEESSINTSLDSLHSLRQGSPLHSPNMSKDKTTEKDSLKSPFKVPESPFRGTFKLPDSEIADTESTQAKQELQRPKESQEVTRDINQRDVLSRTSSTSDQEILLTQSQPKSQQSIPLSKLSRKHFATKEGASQLNVSQLMTSPKKKIAAKFKLDSIATEQSDDLGKGITAKVEELTLEKSITESSAQSVPVIVVPTEQEDEKTLTSEDCISSTTAMPTDTTLSVNYSVNETISPSHVTQTAFPLITTTADIHSEEEQKNITPPRAESKSVPDDVVCPQTTNHELYASKNPKEEVGLVIRHDEDTGKWDMVHMII